MSYPYLYKGNIEKGNRVAIEATVIEKKENGNLLVGFYPDTKANLLEINGNRTYQINKKEFLYSAREDIPSEMKTREFENLLIELREVIDEDYCFENGIDYNLGLYVVHLWQFFTMLLISLRKRKKKKKNSQIDYSLFFSSC